MPVPKDKVVAKLNEKYKGRSLSKDFKNKLADKWAEKIESEDDIDSYIEDRDDIILETISESDRRAKQAADKAKDEAAKAIKGEKVEEPKEVELPDDTPQWMKSFILKQNETIEALNKKVETFQTARSQETLAERFNKIEGFDKIPEKIRNRFIPKTEEEFETNKAELAETWNALGVENRGKGFGSDKPSGNPKSENNTDEPTKENVDAVMANLNL